MSLYKKSGVLKFQYGNKLVPNSRSNFDPNYIDPNLYLQNANYQNSLLKDQQADYASIGKNASNQKQLDDVQNKMAYNTSMQGLSALQQAGAKSAEGSNMSKVGSGAGKVAAGMSWYGYAKGASDMGKGLVCGS